jgi:hypothetical protein
VPYGLYGNEKAITASPMGFGANLLCGSNRDTLDARMTERECDMWLLVLNFSTAH